jgi:hypothetical protein
MALVFTLFQNNLALALSQICTQTKHKIVTLQHYIDTFTGSMAVIQHFIKHKGKIFSTNITAKYAQNGHKGMWHI